jgi:hypothetical protein
MIDQKQVLQIIGNWGYSPSELRKYATEQQKRAKEIGEAVGATMYSSLLALCKYAMSGNAESSITKVNIDSEFITKILGGNKDEFLEILNDVRFSDEVIESIYDICSRHKTLRNAEIALREMVMVSVAPVAAKKIIEVGNDATEQVMECFVAIDNLRSLDSNVDMSIFDDAIKNITSFIHQITRYSDEIKACKETQFEPFNQIVDLICGDVDDIITGVNINILSIIGKPPHVWVEYAIKFGRMMSGFIMALSMGYVTYDDYDLIIRDMRAISVSAKKDNKRVIFGRN